MAETALSMKNVLSDAEDSWMTFEVIENGELGKLEAGICFQLHRVSEILY